MKLCPQGFWSLKSANSIGNINTAESQQKNRKQFTSRRKGSPPLGPGSFLFCTYNMPYQLQNHH